MNAPRILAKAQLANSIGDGVFYVCSVLYYARIVGLSPGQIGLGLTLGWAAGFVTAVPLGHLADRRGPRGTAIALAGATALSVGSLLLVRSFVAFAIVICVYASCQTGLNAARQALLAALVAPAERTRIRAYLQSTVNAGLAVGAAIGGVALSIDTAAAYLVVLGLDAAGFVLAAVLLRRLPAVPATSRTAGEPRLAVLRDRPYALIAFLNAVMLLYMPLLSVVTPLWIAQRTEAPRWLVAALFVVNTASVMLFQVRVARRVTDLRTAVRSVRRAGVVMLLACVAFMLSAGPSPIAAMVILLAGAAVQVVAEMLHASGSWEISFDLAPADKQGQYQGFFGSGVAVARMLGPVLLTTLILTGGRIGWLVFGGLFLLAACAMGPATRWAERTRRTTPVVLPVTTDRR